VLRSLSVKNYALINEVEVEFDQGLNILTGETGAGKSIIVGALGTILGERVDMTMLRNGASKAIIEGRFSISGNGALKKILLDNDLTADDEIILRREILENGRSRAFINDTPVQAALLQTVSDLLIDFHGQHDHQSLLKVQNHLGFLDDFGDFKKELAVVAESYQMLQSQYSELTELEKKQTAFREKRDQYHFQINEINKVNPSAAEEDNLVYEERIVQNSERLFKLTGELYELLYEGENSVYDLMGRVDAGLNELATIDAKFSAFIKDFSGAKVAIEDLSNYLQRYQSSIAFNPQRLEEIQIRMSDLSGLKKKYGLSIEEILKQRDKFAAELDNLGNLDSQIESLKEKIQKEQAVFSGFCLNLSQKRKQTAEELESLIPEILGFLGMSNTRFKVVLKYQDDPEGWVRLQGKTYYATASGMDVAEFVIAANKGEDVRPLAKVASGGEISRIMLALKSAVASKDRIPVLVFDEIDIGVSGRVAQSVGRKLKELSQFHQIICITHLPQIASMGDQHFLVEKVERSARTETSIRKLNEDERTEAIAKLLAGERISEAHLKSARELLEDAAAN